MLLPRAEASTDLARIPVTVAQASAEDARRNRAENRYVYYTTYIRRLREGVTNNGEEI